jgi:hypothetical protein
MGLAQPQHPPSATVRRLADEMTVPELSFRLDRPIGSFYAWIRYGLLPVRRVQADYREILLIRLADAQSLLERRHQAARRRRQWNTPEP